MGSGRLHRSDGGAARWHTFIKTCPRPPLPAAERFSYLDGLDQGTLAWLEAELAGCPPPPRCPAHPPRSAARYGPSPGRSRPQPS